MWRDTLVWDDTLTWSDDELIGEALTEAVVITPAPIPDIVGGLSDRLKTVENKTEHNIQPAQTDTFITAVDAGYILEYIIANNTSVNTAVLSCGYSTDTDEIFTNNSFPPGSTVVEIKKVFSFDTSTDVSINASQSGDDWNSAEIDFYFITKKI